MGTAAAPMQIPDSIKQMITIIDGLTNEKDNGQFGGVGFPNGLEF